MTLLSPSELNGRYLQPGLSEPGPRIYTSYDPDMLPPEELIECDIELVGLEVEGEFFPDPPTECDIELTGCEVDAYCGAEADVAIDSVGVDAFSSGEGEADIELGPLEVDAFLGTAYADIVLPLPEMVDCYFQTCGEVFLPLHVLTAFSGITADIQIGPLAIDKGISAAIVRLSKIKVTSQTGMLSGDNELSLEVDATAQDHQEYLSEIALEPLTVESLTGGIAENIKLGNVAVSSTAHVPANFHADLIELGSLLVSSHVSTRKRTTANLVLGKMSVSSLLVSGWDVSASISLRQMQVRSFMETENLLLADILLSAMECTSWAWAEDAEGFTADFALPGMAVSAKTVSTLADWYYLQYEMDRRNSGSSVDVTPEDDGYFYFTHRRND